MKSVYLIERLESGDWVLRRFGAHPEMGRAGKLDTIRKTAFGRLRGFAPCALRILVHPLEEWLWREKMRIGSGRRGRDDAHRRPAHSHVG